MNKEKAPAKKLEVEVQNNLPVLMAQNNVKSLAQLSRETEIDYQMLHGFKNNELKYVNPQMLGILCSFFGCSIGDLLVLVIKGGEKN